MRLEEGMAEALGIGEAVKSSSAVKRQMRRDNKWKSENAV